MTATRSQVCAEARTWLGTPWAHQGHLKGVGVDCGGLIGGVALALGLVPPDFWERAFAPHAGYARQPTGNSLLHVLGSFMERIPRDEAIEADVVVLQFLRAPHHVGFLVPYETCAGVRTGLALIHALNGGAVSRVVEHRLDERWRSRIVAAFALPGVAG